MSRVSRQLDHPGSMVASPVTDIGARGEPGLQAHGTGSQGIRSQGIRTQGDDWSIDDRGSPILHVDLDAFYASVELRDRPELRGLPVIVGGSRRGVVLSATYEARRFGVHAAMPTTRARRLCPSAVFLAPRHHVYAEVSAGVMEILRAVTPLVEPLSMDEAFLDVTGARRRLGSPTRIAEQIRARICDEQGVTASVGVAPTKFVAKLASTRSKPDGLLVIPADEVVPFLHGLDVGALWGVGERTEEQLTRLGLRTVSDLANVPEATLIRAFGKALGAHLSALAWGRDDRPVVSVEPERSVGGQETFSRDVDDPEALRRELLRLSTRVGARLRAAGLQGCTVTLTVRFADFSTLTRSRTLRDSTDVTQEIYATAAALLDGLGLQRARLRMLGVRVGRLVDPDCAPRQLAFGEADQGWPEADRAMDRAVRRFGSGSVRLGSLIGASGGAP